MKYSNLRFFLAALIISLLIAYKANSQTVKPKTKDTYIAHADNVIIGGDDEPEIKPQKKASKDTISPQDAQQKYLDSMNKLIKEKFSFSMPLIDSALLRMENTLTVTEHRQANPWIQYFINIMVQTWLDDYKRRKLK